MTWGDFIQGLIHKPILLFATATTGVNSDDCLLAVSYAKMGTKPELGTLYYSAPASCALNGVEYHKISMHILNTRGLSMSDFSEQVNMLFRESTPMSYNPGFQERALNEMTECDPVHVFDFPLLFKLAQSKMALKAEDLDAMTSLYPLEKKATELVRVAPPFKRLMASNKIVADPQSDQLPVVTNVQILMRLWERFVNIELVSY